MQTELAIAHSADIEDETLTRPAPAVEPRLVLVSNRVLNPSGKPSGGLAVGLSEALSAHDGLWFGWNGEIASGAPSGEARENVFEGFRTLTTDLSQAEHDEYYLGFANECLWPLLHYRTDLVQCRPSQERHYYAANRRLAGMLAAELAKNDLVWVHDYHLIPFAEALREQGLSNRIGFFLHTPFPAPEIFAAAANHRRLGRALFAYDLVAFQTNGDRDNFERYAVRWLGARRRPDGRLSLAGQVLQVADLPIGIDVADFAAHAQRHAHDDEIEGLMRACGDSTLMVGVERLDYSKGLPERVAAFHHLLDSVPDMRGRIQYLQVATPTRSHVKAYEDIREALDKAIGGVNGRFGTFAWEPVRYLNTPAQRPFLAGLFRRARVGLVTPLRDGMNLVAKEYVAAQDPEDPGVLVLSQFAGAAQQMGAAVIVNPHNRFSIAEGIRQACEMSLEERKERHLLLLERISREDVRWWRESFIAALKDESASRTGPYPVPDPRPADGVQSPPSCAGEARPG
ncbi:MAG: trehalose-6-phosphate synthase [Sneathiellaceae bacterium]